MWVWQHRHQIPGAVRFLRDVPDRWRSGRRDDVLTEARLRVKLAADARTRDHDVLVRVEDGVAVLDAGKAASAAAADIARTAKGIREVDISAAPVVVTTPVGSAHRTAVDPMLAKLSG